MTEEEKQLLENVGQMYAGLREQSGMTQRQAAKKAESTQARLSYLETGKYDVRITTLQNWARVYGYELEIHLVPEELAKNT